MRLTTEKVQAAFEKALGVVLSQNRSFHFYVPEADQDLFAKVGEDLSVVVEIPTEEDPVQIRLQLVAQAK